ncbi:MAG: transcriptional regulator [bacterium]|nr:transcriptional regulator [bacterium]
MKPRYRFGEFTVSPSRRLLLRGGREVALIPRYFDLLLLLVERRAEAIPRREILDRVWSDVVVSDGALSQAVRTLRRALGDEPRQPRFVRTVSRHGYRFVFAEVIEEDDGAEPERCGDEAEGGPPATDAIDEALRSLLATESDEAARRDAAERLHALGTREGLERLGDREGHAAVRALLRDTRWDLADAGPVPILGRPQPVRTFLLLLRLRASRVLRLIEQRWISAVLGGALAGLVAGLLGGLLLRFGPGSTATAAVLLALPLIGLVIGAAGATGVGAGLALAEALIRSYRGSALVLFGAAGGGLIGIVAHFIGWATLAGLFGRDLSPLAGGFEGMVLGAAVGLGYAVATPRAEGGMASPRGAARLWAVAAAGIAGAAAAGVLGATGSYLGAMSLDFMAGTFPGSQVGLDPLARLLGESAPGAISSTVVSAWEGLMFGAGVVAGLTRRPR